ncbi:gustatory receptor 21 [Nasonia vitripennis]|uniref:Gustatory receptor n=1 Tax=Nasonia vitripennis TaxID=7425 RepID=A0A7M6UW43_NASVI|nr:gustatory receptor 21 [Nasonia vitripennis]
MICKPHYTSDFFFLKCLFYWFKIFGTSPMGIDFTSAVKSNDVPQDVHFVFSKLGILHNAILVCLAIIPSCVTIKEAYHTEYTDRLQLERVIDTVHAVATIMTFYFILINVCINQKRAVAIANQLNSIYSQSTSLFSKSKIRPNRAFRSVKKIVSIHMVLMLLLCLFAFTFVHQNLIYHLFINFTNVTIYVMALQYSLVLKLLQHLYRSLNADLRSFLITRDRRDPSSISLPIDELQCRLMQVYEIHASVSRVSQDVCDFYSLPLFFLFAIAFFTLVLFFYYFMLVLLLMNKMIDYGFVLPFFLTLLGLTILAISTLARIAGGTVKESNITREIVSESIMNQRNQPISGQLRDFLHYLQQKNAKFTVFDLFPINESLLMSIASSISTYLVILLQFKESNSTQQTAPSSAT